MQNGIIARMSKLLPSLIKLYLSLIPVMLQRLLQVFLLLSDIVRSYECLFGQLGYPLLLHAILALFFHNCFSITVINCLYDLSLHTRFKYNTKLVIINSETAFFSLDQFLGSLVVSFLMEMGAEDSFKLFRLFSRF